MPERLDIKTQNTPEWAALCTLAELSEEVMQRVIDRKDPDGLLVELRINGEECSFVTIINRLKESAVRWSYERAREIIEERAEILSDKLRNLEEFAKQFEDHFKTGLTNLFPEVIRESDYS